jgi:hypothetical protein
MQLQSHIWLVSSAAVWYSVQSVLRREIGAHGMIPKANWLLVTRHNTSFCKANFNDPLSSRPENPEASYHRRSSPLLSTAEVVSCSGVPCAVATGLFGGAVSSPASLYLYVVHYWFHYLCLWPKTGHGFL